MSEPDAEHDSETPQSLDDREECMAVGCEEVPVEIHIPVDGAVEYEPHALCEEHSRMTKNKIRDIGAGSAEVATMANERLGGFPKWTYNTSHGSVPFYFGRGYRGRGLIIGFNTRFGGRYLWIRGGDDGE